MLIIPKNSKSFRNTNKTCVANRPYTRLTWLPFPSVPRILRVPAAFFPGLRVILPTNFSAAPSILSLRCGFRLWWVAGALVAPVCFLTPVWRWVVVVVLPLCRLRSGSVDTVRCTRGLEWPVEARVEAVMFVVLCLSGRGEGCCWFVWNVSYKW